MKLSIWQIQWVPRYILLLSSCVAQIGDDPQWIIQTFFVSKFVTLKRLHNMQFDALKLNCFQNSYQYYIRNLINSIFQSCKYVPVSLFVILSILVKQLMDLMKPLMYGKDPRSAYEWNLKSIDISKFLVVFIFALLGFFWGKPIFNQKYDMNQNLIHSESKYLFRIYLF